MKKEFNLQLDKWRHCGLTQSIQCLCSSLDYDAPLSEAGDITEKFRALRKVIEKYNLHTDKQGTVKPVLSGPVLNGHPLLSGQL